MAQEQFELCCALLLVTVQRIANLWARKLERCKAIDEMEALLYRNQLSAISTDNADRQLLMAELTLGHQMQRVDNVQTRRHCRKQLSAAIMNELNLYELLEATPSLDNCALVLSVAQHLAEDVDAFTLSLRLNAIGDQIAASLRTLYIPASTPGSAKAVAPSPIKRRAPTLVRHLIDGHDKSSDQRVLSPVLVSGSSFDSDSTSSSPSTRRQLFPNSLPIARLGSLSAKAKQTRPDSNSAANVHALPPTRADPFVKSIQVGSTKTVGTSLKPFVVYECIAVKPNGEELFVSRRYTDFVSLREIVLKKYPEVALEMPKLPEKKLIGNLKPSFVEKRREGLEEFLQFILTHSALRGHELLRIWFDPSWTST